MDALSRWLLLLHLASTFYMVGVIWFVQVVHYPLFAEVGTPNFPRYESLHVRLTTYVVMPAMLVEVATAILLFWQSPTGVSHWLLWVGLALLVVIWGSTFLFQVPQHETLASGFDSSAQGFLVLSNWIRTVAWSIRGGLVLWMMVETWK